MTNLPSPIPPEEPETAPIDPQLQDLTSEWQFARIRLVKLVNNPELRQELLLVTAMLAIVFCVPAIAWFRSWTLSPAIQSYAIFILPLAIYWVWIARRRLAVPEIEHIRKTLRLERQAKMMHKEIGERNKTILDALIEDEAIQDVRSRMLLYCAVAIDLTAFWLRDPTLTCIGFILTCAGMVLYRHGKFALRAAMFPLLLLCVMTPIPGPVRDAVLDRAQPAILGMVEHIVNNVKQIAALPPEGDPLKITETVGTYPIYAERSGLCISESIFVMVVAFFYLSLIRTGNPLPKIGVIASTGVVCFVVIIARLILISAVATYDKDSAALLEVLTVYLLFGIDLGFLFLFVRGFKCVKFHRWASLSLKY